MHGVNTNNSNESVPVRSAQDISASQQSYNYDFLYDPEVARQGPTGSAASIKYSGQSSQSRAAQSAALSPHVFMLSTEGNEPRNNRSATQQLHHSSKGAESASQNSRHQRHSSNSENVAPTVQAQPPIAHQPQP